MQPRVPILILHLLVPGNPGLFEVKKISKDDSNLSNMLAWMNFLIVRVYHSIFLHKSPLYTNLQ